MRWGEAGGVRHSEPLAIHHSPVFDSPNAVVELPFPLFMAAGGLDEAELFILAGLIIHALSHSHGKAETEAQTSRGPGG